VLNGVTQDPVHGTSFAYAFNAPDAPDQLKTSSSTSLGHVPSTTMAGSLVP